MFAQNVDVRQHIQMQSSRTGRCAYLASRMRERERETDIRSRGDAMDVRSSHPTKAQSLMQNPPPMLRSSACQKSHPRIAELKMFFLFFFGFGVRFFWGFTKPGGRRDGEVGDVQRWSQKKGTAEACWRFKHALTLVYMPQPLLSASACLPTSRE